MSADLKGAIHLDPKEPSFLASMDKSKEPFMHLICNYGIVVAIIQVIYPPVHAKWE